MWIPTNKAKAIKNNSGFTLIELMVTLLISTIIVAAIGVMVADSSGWFSDSYSRINSDPAIQSLLTRKTFERVMRQASSNGFWVSPDSTAVEINYYSSPTSPIDSYAQFFVSGTDLILERGTLVPKTPISTETVCQNLSTCTFKAAGSAVQMILILDDGKNKQESMTSAILHN
jgi:prepilin-type N-terminal cleavage/methylation domain-containing protein